MVTAFLDIDQVNERVDQLLHQLGALGLSWRPDLSGHRNMYLSEQILKRGVQGIAVSDLNTAGSVTTNASSILVTVPPPLRDIDFVRLLPRMTDSILAVDHFVQAEKISEMAQHWGISQSVVIEIETGCGRTGVRPGNDALALAEGIARLPSVHVIGLTTQNTDRDVSNGALSALQDTIGWVWTVRSSVHPEFRQRQDSDVSRSAGRSTSYAASRVAETRLLGSSPKSYRDRRSTEPSCITGGDCPRPTILPGCRISRQSPFRKGCRIIVSSQRFRNRQACRSATKSG